jgi:hypothetical protein
MKRDLRHGRVLSHARGDLPRSSHTGGEEEIFGARQGCGRLFETLVHALYERCLFEEVSNPLLLLINYCNAMLCDAPGISHIFRPFAISPEILLMGIALVLAQHCGQAPDYGTAE